MTCNGCRSHVEETLSKVEGVSKATVDLEKAEEMSKSTVDRNPNSPVYLDTYGWVLFRLGKYPEAVTALQTAVKNDPSKSGEIIEHLGDAQAMNGQLDEAIVNWMKAKTSGGSDKLDQKIKLKQYVP